MKMNTQQPQVYGNSESSPERKVHSITGLPKEARNTSDKQSNIHLKELEKWKTQWFPEVGRRKKIIKVRAKINDIEIKKIILKINETKSWLFEKINKIVNLQQDLSRK